MVSIPPTSKQNTISYLENLLDRLMDDGSIGPSQTIALADMIEFVTSIGKDEEVNPSPDKEEL